VIGVLIVDDHAVVRAGLRLLLEREDDLEVLGEAGDAREAVFLTRRHKPSVILLDVSMPGRSGVDVIAELLGDSPESRVLMLSMEDDPSYVRRAFAAGATGYVLKEAVEADVVQAIRKVADGEQYVHPSLGAKLVAPAPAGNPDQDPLSDREREVLSLLALGHTNHEIADKLVVSVRTVESHRSHILSKLRLATRAELVRYALDNGLLDRP
jgi:two-component system, NarL family, response regulator NreC